MCTQLEVRPTTTTTKTARVEIDPANMLPGRRLANDKRKVFKQPKQHPALKARIYQRRPDLLVKDFEDGTLSREHWTHAAHLTVALYYAHNHRIEAYEKMREGIQRYNRLTKLVETPTTGFHETITRAWFQLVLHFLDLFDDGRSVESLALDLVQLFPKEELFRHYSRGVLLSLEARRGWVEPDLKALPELELHTPADRRFLAALAPARDLRSEVDDLYVIRPRFGSTVDLQRRREYVYATRR